MATCANCGGELGIDDRFCGSCGTAVGTGAQPTPPASVATSVPLTAPTTDGMAIASLACSIGGFFSLPVILHIVGVALGIQSKRRIAESGGTLSGEAIAQAGLIIGIIGLALFGIVVIVILAVMFVFAF